MRDTLRRLDAEIIACRACPRLVAWREEVASTKRAAFADQDYWGRPVTGFGDSRPQLLIVGLAPAAHGANRTGRVFTGDRSGDWLFAALHRTGYATRPHSVSRDDGQQLIGARVTAAVRCAPPQNKPTPDERDRCASFLQREIALTGPRVILALGAFGWDAVLRVLPGLGISVGSPRPRFGHGAQAQLGAMTLLGCYHPSQQNTFTGRLTESMIDSVLVRARALCSQ